MQARLQGLCEPQGPEDHDVKDIMPRSCTQDTASQRPQGLQARGADVTHHEDTGVTHRGAALGCGAIISK